MQTRVLLVDDLQASRALSALASRGGYHVEAYVDVDAGLRALSSGRFDVALVDLDVGALRNGFRVLERVRDEGEGFPIIMTSSRADVPDTANAFRMGAADFLLKPVVAADLTRSIQSALKPTRPTSARRMHEGGGESELALDWMVGSNPAMRRVVALADRVASSPSTSALILGESGVGKEGLAARIHTHSSRSASPFIRVNVAAIPDSMFDAELFGSVRGAYTDSRQDRVGLLGSAQGGTVLLDELCELRMDLQPKLLRVLEERRYFPLGSDKERRLDARILAATNRDPHEAIASRSLRRDLYYRLSTVVIRIPPLRERQEDIVPLAEHFVRHFAHELGRQKPRITPRAAREMIEYPWPGNVRELRNFCERAVIFSESDVLDNGPLSSRDREEESTGAFATGEAPSLLKGAYATSKLESLESVRDRALTFVEAEHIRFVLEACEGSKSRAAEILGISRSTLWEKMKRYGLH